MFVQKNRLRKEKDIKMVFSKGKSTYDSICGIKWKKNGLEDTRFAIVIGTKVHKRAVRRNRLKRQYRDTLKSLLPHLPHDIDVLLLVRKEALDLTAIERKERLTSVFRKAKLLKEEKA
jgi:ribonuclease P protein component